MTFDLKTAVEAFLSNWTVVPATMGLALVIMALAIVLGMVIALVRIYKIPVLSKLAAVFVSFMRGTPLIVLLFIVYFSLPDTVVFLGKLFGAAADPNKVSPLYSVIITYSMYISAFQSENIKGALASVEKGQMEAAYWSRIEALPVKYGTWGETLKLAQYVEKLTGGKTPFVQTIFSPLTTAQKLAGDRILKDMKEDPGLFKQALQAITDTTVDFVKANIEAGVSGFFFATRCANYGYMTEEEYKEFGEYFDIQVINAYKDITFFNIVHIHGELGMFSLIEKYPVNCINWHDRWTPPTLAEARKLSGKCFLGGLREVPYYSEDGEVTAPSILNSGSPADVEKHVAEAIEQLNGKGLIIGPGCGADQFVPEKNIHAIRRAAGYKHSKKHLATYETVISSADAIQI